MPKPEWPVKFSVRVEEDLIVLKIEEGYLTEEYEMDADDAVLTGSQLIQAAHKVRNAK